MVRKIVKIWIHFPDNEFLKLLKIVKKNKKHKFKKFKKKNSIIVFPNYFLFVHFFKKKFQFDEFKSGFSKAI